MDTHTISIELPDPLGAYVLEKVSRGEYASEAEYLRELVRRDRERQTEQQLRRLIETGLASGPATPLEEADITSIREQVAAAGR